MWHYFNVSMNWINQIDRQQWFFILLAVLVMGAFWLRGFGSRSNY
jgi:hypothetical protein